MLIQLLQFVRNQPFLSFSELEQKMQVSVGLLLSMVEALVQKGYLQSISANCGSCQLASGCDKNLATQAWMLSPKGEQFLQSQG